jgi:arginine/lysine/ornithine decarboxylase
MRHAGAAGFDPTHVTFDVAPIGISGYAADDHLRDEQHIDVELADHRRLMALVTYAHEVPDVERLLGALRGLTEQGRDASDVPRIPGPTRLRTETVMTPREAFYAPVENVHRRQVVGRIAAEIVTPYPPGIPVLAPGERITDDLIDYLEAFVTAGGFVEGATDPTLDRFRVVTD